MAQTVSQPAVYANGLIRKFWKASIHHSFPYSHTHNAINFLWVKFEVLMLVTLKIVLWDVMLCVTLMLVGAGSMLLWNTGIVSKKKAIFLQSFNFQILCNILVSDFMPSISSPMSLWAVNEANGRQGMWGHTSWWPVPWMVFHEPWKDG